GDALASIPAKRSRRVSPAGCCRGRRLPVRLLLVSALACATPAPAAAESGGAAKGAAEMQGAHVVSWGRVKVAAAPEAAFAVLTDYTRMTDFLPGLLTSEVLSRQGNTVVVAQV